MSEDLDRTDLLDALAGDDTDRLTEDDHRLATIVDNLFVAYMPPDEPRRTLLLRRFTDFGTAVLETSSPRRRRVAAAVAMAGTVTGKLVLSGAVAVAAVGGLHASGTVHVPLLPEVGEHHDSEVDTNDPDLETDATVASTTPRTSTDSPSSDASGASRSVPTSTSVGSGPDADSPSPTIGGPTGHLPPTVTIPAPTVPPAPPETPPILDPGLQTPGPTIPDAPP